VSFIALALAPATIGGPPFAATVEPVPGGLDISAPGRGLGGTNDQVHFSQELRTGDFDVAVRLESLQLTTLFTQAGLLVRQSLAPGSPFAASLATPSLAGSFFTWRGATNAITDMQGTFPSIFRRPGCGSARRLHFTGYASYDGTARSRLGTAASRCPTPSTSASLSAAARPTLPPSPPTATPTTSPLPRPRPAPASRVLEPLGPSSRRTSLVLSEIMYHAADGGDRRQLEFVEIANTDSTFVDLGGYRLSGAVDFTFPAGTRPSCRRIARRRAGAGRSEDATGLAGVLGPGPAPPAPRWRQPAPPRPTGAVFLEVDYSDEPRGPSRPTAPVIPRLARPSHGEG
jgi:hypothetical protein